MSFQTIFFVDYDRTGIRPDIREDKIHRPGLRVRVSPFYFSIFADVSIFTRNFYPFSQIKQSIVCTTQTGKSNTNFLTHTEALSLYQT